MFFILDPSGLKEQNAFLTVELRKCQIEKNQYSKLYSDAKDEVNNDIKNKLSNYFSEKQIAMIQGKSIG